MFTNGAGINIKSSDFLSQIPTVLRGLTTFPLYSNLDQPLTYLSSLWPLLTCARVPPL